ncbi:hypothetical protein V6N13_030022 [Hibiscus sabdariffa]|uniref:J domain-containing protein n=2 Tax=Hibiscus sabdariffa TaxID=183260 RepID=A0ABR2T938_9ROSI
MATPFLAGLAVAAAALASRYGIQAWQAFKTRPPKPKIRKFYDGGFQPTMTRREAALILGVRFLSIHERHIYELHPKKYWGSDYSTLTLKATIYYESVIYWENTTPDKVKEAHRKVMVANHPDAGGSHYLASKINEAKDVMLGKTKGSGSAF